MSFAAGRAAGLAESPQQGSEWHSGSHPRRQSDRGGRSSSSWDGVGILGNRKATCSATGHVPAVRRTLVITLSALAILNIYQGQLYYNLGCNVTIT